MKHSKKIVALLLALVMVFSLAACGDNGGKEGGDKSGDAKKIGVLLYNATDTYIGTVRQALEKIDAADDSIEMEFVDGQNNQGTQTDQLNALIQKGVDGLLINIVEFESATNIMETCENEDVPFLFFNRDVTKDFEGTDKTIFVGTNAPEAGVMQGEIIKEYAEKHDDFDRNGDGVIQYVLLHGGLENAEAVARSEYSVKTAEEAGLKMEQLEMQIASWEQVKAKEAMDQWLQKHDNIELVIANNDTMALGAVEALLQAGFNGEGQTFIPVIGVDAIDEAVKAINDGTLAGTVKQDAEGMAEAITALIKNRMAGKDWLEGTDYKLFEDGKSVRIPYQIVTQ